MSKNPRWNYANDCALLIACVGYDLGEAPLERLDEISAARGCSLQLWRLWRKWARCRVGDYSLGVNGASVKTMPFVLALR